MLIHFGDLHSLNKSNLHINVVQLGTIQDNVHFEMSSN